MFLVVSVWSVFIDKSKLFHLEIVTILFFLGCLFTLFLMLELQPLPTTFCRQYLPAKDTIMILETQAGERYKAKFLSRSLILSGGWIRFAKDMNLKVGDIAVFHLVSATKFKVVVYCSLQLLEKFILLVILDFSLRFVSGLYSLKNKPKKNYYCLLFKSREMYYCLRFDNITKAC